MKSRDETFETPDATQLNRALRSEESTSIIAALECLTASSTDSETIREAVPAAVPLLSHRNAYLQQRAASTLKVLSSEGPALLEHCIPDIVQRFEEDTDHRGDIVEVLAQVIDRNDYDLDSEAIDSLTLLFKDAHDTETRKSICRLMGNSVRLHAAKKLQETFEVDQELQEIAQDELEQMGNRAVDILVEDGVGTDGEAVAVLRFLVHNHPTAIEDRLDELTQVIDSENSAVSSLLTLYAGKDGTDSSRIKQKLLEIVEIDETSPARNRRRAEAALPVLVKLDLAEVEISRLVNQFRDWLSSKDTALQVHAATQLSSIAEFRPHAVRTVRDALRDSINSENPDLAKAARRAYILQSGEYSGNRCDIALGLVEDISADSAVSTLGNQLDLLRFRDEVEGAQWRSIDVGTIGHGILSELRQMKADGKSVPIVLPRYSPPAIMTVVLELLLAERGGNSVALLSPGTRNHWGLKGDFKREFKKYGLADGLNQRKSTTPIADLIPSSHITDDGKIVDYSDFDGPGRLILTKKPDELLAIEPESVDAIVLNLTARTKAEYEQQLGDVREHFDVPVIAMYTPYTKHEGEGYPRYGPPAGLEEVDALPSYRCLEEVKSNSVPQPGNHLHPINSDWALLDTATDREIEIIGIDSGGLSETFDRVYEMSDTLRSAGLDRPAGKLFSVQFLFERLPIPSDTFDNRIYERSIDGERWLPWTTDKYISNLREYAGHVEDSRVPSMAFEASGLLQGVREELAEYNPMYDGLKQIIRNARQSGNSLAVFTHKNGWEDLLENALREDDDIPSTAFVNDRIQIVTPDSARNLQEVDWMVITGPLPHQLAGYYLLPGVSRTIVLTYEGSWTSLVERHSTQYVERMNDAIDGPNVRPYEEPVIEVDWEEEQPVVLEDDLRADEERASESGDRTPEESPRQEYRGQLNRRADLERLAEAFEHADSGEFQEHQDRYGDETYRTYKVETRDGKSLTLGNHETYLRKGPNGAHHWVSPGSLTEGDVLAVIDSDIETELWSEHLEELYSDELEESDATSGVRIWYQTLSEILQETANEIGTEPDESRTLQEITAALSAGGLERTSATMRSWFNSVLVADDALDLARDSSLRIGPRSEGDIQIIGEVFDKPELAQQSDMIERSMNAVRRLNQSEGFEFSEELLRDLDSESSTRVKSATNHFEIANITILNEEDDSGG